MNTLYFWNKTCRTVIKFKIMGTEDPLKKATSGLGCILLTTRERLYFFTFIANVIVLFRNVSFLHTKSSQIYFPAG